jgi:hypothetical protein
MSSTVPPLRRNQQGPGTAARHPIEEYFARNLGTEQRKAAEVSGPGGDRKHNGWESALDGVTAFPVLALGR